MLTRSTPGGAMTAVREAHRCAARPRRQRQRDRRRQGPRTLPRAQRPDTVTGDRLRATTARASSSYCHAGCSYTEVLDALGLTDADLFDDAAVPERLPHHRYLPLFRRSQGSSQARQDIPAVGQQGRPQPVPRRTIGTADAVYVVEGEKDVLAIEAIGGVAVCSAMGAGKAHLADWFPLTGKQVDHRRRQRRTRSQSRRRDRRASRGSRRVGARSSGRGRQGSCRPHRRRQDTRRVRDCHRFRRHRTRSR